MHSLNLRFFSLVASLTLAGCLPEAPARECDSHGCAPGYSCRLSDGRCERNAVDPETLCEGVRVDLLTDRHRCGRCEPTSCLTCESGECSVARGIVATYETALALPWTSVGLVQQWRGWGRPVFEDGPRSVPFPLDPTFDASVPRLAATPLIASREFDAHSTQEVALCSLYASPSSRIDGTLCVVRDGVVRCAGQFLPQEGTVDGGRPYRWRVVDALGGTTALACASVASTMSACAWNPGRRQLRCQTTWLDPTREVPIEPRVSCGFDGGAGAIETVESIGMGLDFACAIASICGRRAVLCWGSASPGAPSCFPNGPQVIALPSTPRSLSVGIKHACAVTEAGEVWCWGVGFRSRLGRGSRGSLSCEAPAPVLRSAGVALSNAREVRTFTTSTCARVEENSQGVVYCWGDCLFPEEASTCPTSSSSMLGTVAYATRIEAGSAGPVHVSNAPWSNDVLAVGNGFACALAADAHDVFCWGKEVLGSGFSVSAAFTPPRAIPF